MIGLLAMEHQRGQQKGVSGRWRGVCRQYGEFQIDVPRDRNGEFEPKLIPKYPRDISGIEEKSDIFICPWYEYT